MMPFGYLVFVICSCINVTYTRASQGLKARRLNHARDLLQRSHHLPDAVSRMVQDSALSPRQAYRYSATSSASEAAGERYQVAFTVKLSRKLVRQVRTRAQDAGLSLSEFVSRALSTLLTRRRGRG